MDAPLYVDAVLVEDGVIQMAGERDEVLRRVTPQTRVVNLNGSVLLPGFIDTHGHFAAFAQTLGVVQLGGCKSFAEIRDKLREYCEQNKPGGRDWVIGFGYHHLRLAEKQHPDRRTLDAALPGYRVLISHESGEMGVMSSVGLAVAGVTAASVDPKGGKIGRVPGTAEPDGFFSGTAFEKISAAIDPPSENQMLGQLARAQNIYAQHGITTLQEGATHEDEWAALRAFSDSGKLLLDVVSYIDLKESKHIAQENLSRVQRYKRHLKIGGYTLALDGDTQERSAWMSTPYAGEQHYRGEQLYSDDEAQMLLFEILNEHLQALVQCSGDAAVEQFLHCCAEITDGLDVELRPVMAHTQFVRPDQLTRMARMGMIPSFFISQIFYFGDQHLQMFGPERAAMISPTQAAKQAGLPFTLHQDAPMLLPNILAAIWCAVNRTTRAGAVLGPEEQISTLDALRAVTVNAAYQYFEEDSKGSISVGKRADFVVLDYNPLRVRPADLKRIRVMKTIKDDRVIYERN